MKPERARRSQRTPKARGANVMRACLLAVIALGAGCGASPAAIEFEDVTESVGLAEHLERWRLGHGGAWGDVTGNDRPDLYIGAFADRPFYADDDAPWPNMLFLNSADGFVRSDDPAIRFDTRGEPKRYRARVAMALFADLNNSGKLDLLAGTHSGPESQLYENRGADGFANVTPDADDPYWPHDLHMRNATVIDLDQDGLLDLILLDGRYRSRDQRVVALRNLGDFRFEDVSEEYGFAEERTRALGSAVGDVNHNGRLDLFVADSNRLFLSNDDGTYEEYRPGFFGVTGLSRRSQELMCGAAFADLTGNGLLDLVVTLHGRAREREPEVPGHIFLYLNRGIDENGMPEFEDVTAEAGLGFVLPRDGRTGLDLRAAHVALVDLDHNGRRDVLTSIVREDDDGRLQPVVLRNRGVNDDGVPQFDVPPLDSLVGYYATAPVTDFDRDGRIDIFMATWFADLESRLFRNVTKGGNYLVVRVRGEADDLNPMGVGATVRLYEPGHAGDDERLLGRGDIALANGYSVGDEAMAHFGLAEREACDVVVTWQGRRVTLTDVEVNQYLDIGVE